MDLAAAMNELPEVHAKALRLHRAGTDTAVIAEQLGIEREAVAPLLRVANAKLATLLAAPDPPGTRAPPGPGQDPQPGHEPGS
jgi:DNA-directed RNA polymerase specialized sigma24 family protein